VAHHRFGRHHVVQARARREVPLDVIGEGLMARPVAQRLAESFRACARIDQPEISGGGDPRDPPLRQRHAMTRDAGDFPCNEDCIHARPLIRVAGNDPAAAGLVPACVASQHHDLAFDPRSCRRLIEGLGRANAGIIFTGANLERDGIAPLAALAERWSPRR